MMGRGGNGEECEDVDVDVGRCKAEVYLALPYMWCVSRPREGGGYQHDAWRFSAQ